MTTKTLSSAVAPSVLRQYQNVLPEGLKNPMALKISTLVVLSSGVLAGMGIGQDCV